MQGGSLSSTLISLILYEVSKYIYECLVKDNDLIIKFLFRKQKISNGSFKSFLNCINNFFNRIKIPNETLESWWVLNFEIKLTVYKLMMTMGM